MQLLFHTVYLCYLCRILYKNSFWKKNLSGLIRYIDALGDRLELGTATTFHTSMYDLPIHVPNINHSFFLYLRKLTFFSHIFEVKNSLGATCTLFSGQWISLMRHDARWNARSRKLGEPNLTARGRNSQLLKILIFTKAMSIILLIITINRLKSP